MLQSVERQQDRILSKNHHKEIYFPNHAIVLNNDEQPLHHDESTFYTNADQIDYWSMTVKVVRTGYHGIRFYQKVSEIGSHTP